MINKLELCKNIEILSSNEIEEVFKILYKNNSTYTKNNNGIFVNLNWLSDETLIIIDNYVNFCIKSHNEINKYEDICSLLNISINNNKDKIDENVDNIIDTKNIIVNNKQKISSSMKFYLLKKKYLKQNIYTNNMYCNLLTHEEYIL